MVRQNFNPAPYNISARVDNVARRTSARAGEVVLVDYVPVLRGDSVGGQVTVDVILAHMPRRPLNSIVMNVQAWFVPSSIHPQFSGYDEFLASYTNTTIKQIGAADRNPPPFYNVLSGAARAAAIASDHYKALGVSVPDGVNPNDQLFDAYSIVHNFRQAAHSSKIARRLYFREDMAQASKFAPAFWPQNRFSRVVPDYERALVVGEMALDVSAGSIPVELPVEWSAHVQGSGNAQSGVPVTADSAANPLDATIKFGGGGTQNKTSVQIKFAKPGGAPTDGTFVPMEAVAQMLGSSIVSSLQDIDKARVTQAMAKLRASMAGNNPTGFANENGILADMMQGLRVPQELNMRPWLLGSTLVPFSLNERWAMDGASLQDSDTRGSASVTVPVNLPRTETGGYILVTVEVVPERIYERQGDPALYVNSVDELPDALRDVQRVEPVDVVPNWRLDTSHSTPGGTYGYEPMNDRWNREFTMLGGDYYQPVTGSPTPSAARDAIWTPQIVDPAYNSGHFLVPSPFPHSIFSDTNGSAFDVIVRRAAVVRGLTQIGDVLSEDNSEFADTVQP